MTELRKCPFCGGKAEVWVSDVTDRAIAYCTVCDAQIRIRQNEQEAIEAWNKRVPPTTKQIEEYIEKTHKENIEMVAKLKKKYEVEIMTLQEKYCDKCKFTDVCDYTPHECPKVRFLEGEPIEGFDLEKFDAVKSYFGEQ